MTTNEERRAKVRIARIARMDGFADAYLPGIKPTYAWCAMDNTYNRVRTRQCAYTTFTRACRAIARSK
jgi:hypothetical protein